MGTRGGLIGLIVGVALITAGCGGDDDESTTTAESLTKEEFITQADQICADGDAEIAAAAQEAGLGQGSSEEDVNAFLEETVLPNIQGQLDAIEALGIPEEDSGETEELLTALEEAIATAEADPSALGSQSDDTFAEVNALADDYGLTACGGDGA